MTNVTLGADMHTHTLANAHMGEHTDYLIVKAVELSFSNVVQTTMLRRR